MLNKRYNQMNIISSRSSAKCSTFLLFFFYILEHVFEAKNFCHDSTTHFNRGVHTQNINYNFQYM